MIIFILHCTGCASLQSYSNSSVRNNESDNTFFTYKFDPNVPQVDSGIHGTLIEEDNCLFIQAPVRSILMTPIFPNGATKWDKGNGILYIGDRHFQVGEKISINGVSLYGEKELNDARKMFVKKGNSSCLTNKWVIVGTNY